MTDDLFTSTLGGLNWIAYVLGYVKFCDHCECWYRAHRCDQRNCGRKRCRRESVLAVKREWWRRYRA